MTISFTIAGKPVRWQRPIEGTRADGSQYRYNETDAEDAKTAIRKAAKVAFIGKRPFTGPVVVRVVAIFGIPPSWPAKLQRAAREARVMHVADPDLDQIVKLVKDALKGVAYVDDNQVCGYPNSAKRYGAPERTEITISPIAQQADEVTPGQRRLEKRVEVEGWDAVLAPPARRAKTSKAKTGAPAKVGLGRRPRFGGRGFPRSSPRGGEQPS